MHMYRTVLGRKVSGTVARCLLPETKFRLTLEVDANPSNN